MTTTSRESTIFDNAQRTKRQQSWSVWCFRHLMLLTLKFCVAYIFYMAHYSSSKHAEMVRSSQVEASVLQSHLNEFRQESRHRRKHKITLQGEYFWSPLNQLPAQCAPSDLLDPFPESFDAVVYWELHKEDYEHYLQYGRRNGWPCSRGQRLREIMNTEIANLLPGATLEIGPFVNAVVVAGGPTNKVEYVDIGNVATFGNSNSYALIVSSTVVTVVRDLVRHLQQVGNLLQEGGYYTVLVPDKRFSRTQFLAETSVADVLEDFFTAAQMDEETVSSPSRSHGTSLRSIIENSALLVPNDAVRARRGEGGSLYDDASDPVFLQKLKTAIDEYESKQDKKADTFAVGTQHYQFTPHTLAFIVDTVHSLGLTDLRVHRLYDTIQNSDEFDIVLKKCSPV